MGGGLAFTNPVHETMMRDIRRQQGAGPARSASFEVLTKQGIRGTSNTVITLFEPIVAPSAALRRSRRGAFRPVALMQANGGLTTDGRRERPRT